MHTSVFCSKGGLYNSMMTVVRPSVFVTRFGAIIMEVQGSRDRREKVWFKGLFHFSLPRNNLMINNSMNIERYFQNLFWNMRFFWTCKY